MFFPDRLKSIKKGHRVLEIGPGGLPHPKSTVFLEKRFADEDEAAEQRGFAPAVQIDKVIVYYDGGRFPFADGEFDYAICSHVLEHVDDVESFIQELCRVARAGYLEFPTIYYDYVYNIPKHLTMLMYKENNETIYYLPKHETGLDYARDIQEFFFRSTFKGYVSFIDELKVFMFQGFEWRGSIQVKKASCLKDLLYDLDVLDIPMHVKPSLLSLLKSSAMAMVCGVKSKIRGLFQ